MALQPGSASATWISQEPVVAALHPATVAAQPPGFAAPQHPLPILGDDFVAIAPAPGALVTAARNQFVAKRCNLPHTWVRTMSSNAVRIGAKIFEAARQHGQIMSRSAALQVEHWARLGMALEASGLSVAEVAAMLRIGHAGAAAGAMAADDVVTEVSEKQLWAYKRAKQARDIEMVRSGRATPCHQ